MTAITEGSYPGDVPFCFTRGGRPSAVSAKFWMVYVEPGPSPNVQYFDRDGADAEAKRQAILNGYPAYVLEATHGFGCPPVNPYHFKTAEHSD